MTADPDQALTRAERMIARALRARGWTLYRRGWPDFLAITDSGLPVAIEVKAGSDKLRPEQRLMLEALDRIGLPVVVAREPKDVFAAVDDTKRIARSLRLRRRKVGLIVDTAFDLEIAAEEVRAVKELQAKLVEHLDELVIILSNGSDLAYGIADGRLSDDPIHDEAVIYGDQEVEP